MIEDADLDMRMDKNSKVTAKDIINKYSEEELYKIIDEYGEERFAKRIAKNICIARKERSIERSGELVEIIKKSIPVKFQERWTSCKENFPSN